jgi:hypothetical protein
MTSRDFLGEAIERLQARVDGELSIQGVDHCEDMKLGIEALKAVKESRRIWGDRGVGTLPGETEK